MNSRLDSNTTSKNCWVAPLSTAPQSSSTSSRKMRTHLKARLRSSWRCCGTSCHDCVAESLRPCRSRVQVSDLVVLVKQNSKSIDAVFKTRSQNFPEIWSTLLIIAANRQRVVREAGLVRLQLLATPTQASQHCSITSPTQACWSRTDCLQRSIQLHDDSHFRVVSQCW
ncbi:unannotated protein [freshwater metagenome]|uniref:Unannotated protein n=1 Tax=freshwater metagenome TaxID=449393 RepID=A0A6J7GHI2_9ZZZZ